MFLFFRRLSCALRTWIVQIYSKKTRCTIIQVKSFMAQIGIFFQQLSKNVNKLTELMLFNYSKPAVFVNCLYICDALLNYQGAFLPQCLWLTPMRRGRASYENTTYNGMARGRCRASKFKQL